MDLAKRSGKNDLQNTYKEDIKLANNKSAKKRVRANNRKRLRNRETIGSMRTAIYAVKKAVEEGKAATEVKPLFETAQSLIDRAGKKGILHANTAGRRVATLAAFWKRASVK